MGRPADCTAYQRDALAVIAGCEEAPNGRDIQRAFAAAYDREISDTTVYRALDGLVDDGLLEKGAVHDQENYYTLTEAGREALVADLRWRNELTDFQEQA